MKSKLYTLIALLWLGAFAAVQAQPTMAGRLKSYDGNKGLLVLELADNSTRTFAISDKTECLWMGRKASIGTLRAGAKISIQILGALNKSPLKAGKIVDWGNSEAIVAKGAKAPYHTPVGQYASTNGTGGVPDGAPVGQYAPQETLAAVGHGGSMNAPTQQTHPTGSNPATSQDGQSSMGGQRGSTVYRNQGEAMMDPLQMQQMNPMMNPGANPAMMGMNPGMDPSMMGMDPSMMGMDPSMGMMNPAMNPNLGMGQSGALMGMDDGSGGDYSAGADMMGLNSGAYGGGGKLTGRILQANIEQGFIMVQSFSNPQVQRVLLGMGSSAPPNLLVPGQMVEITGKASAQGFQATDIRAATGY